MLGSLCLNSSICLDFHLRRRLGANRFSKWKDITTQQHNNLITHSTLHQQSECNLYAMYFFLISCQTGLRWDDF